MTALLKGGKAREGGREGTGEQGFFSGFCYLAKVATIQKLI